MTTDLAWEPSRAHPGSVHRQSTWRERALDFDRPLPLWLRLSFMAYAHHRRNGHATFGVGELQRVLKTGRQQLYRALTEAKDYGYLDGRSTVRCLVVPPGSTAWGLGHHKDPCAYCDGKKTGRGKVSVTAS